MFAARLWSPRARATSLADKITNEIAITYADVIELARICPPPALPFIEGLPS
jgi:hypothetical protein